MDRRTAKTRAAILNAYKQLLREPGPITVQRIIDSANIGRSTFYTHFSDKSSLPQELFNMLFFHVGTQTSSYPHSGVDALGFPQSNPAEENAARYRLERIFAHLLIHLEREQAIYVKLFRQSDSDWFNVDFYICFKKFFCSYILTEFIPLPENIPEDLYLNYLIYSFMAVIKWRFSSKKYCPPYRMAQLYVQLICAK